MSTHPEAAGKVSLASFVSSLEYSQNRLGAYVFTAVNNGCSSSITGRAPNSRAIPLRR